MSLRRFVISLTLLLGATVAAWSCGDPAPLGVAGPTGTAAFDQLSDRDDGDDGDDTDPEDDREDDDSLVACRPLPYDSVTQTIGPEGGVVEVGRNRLIVPRGALREPVSITAVAPSDTVAVVRFRPEGLRFVSTAQLVLTYDNCRIPRPATPRIAVVTDSLHVIGFLTSWAASPSDHSLPKGHREGHRRVVGELPHFSNYAVAW
ncbi:MAG TPA: hypothetical protein VGQ06_02165 [Gemmatimonadales bacterium]|jgi:hypothetical protein|nr:hypothetical protein [Gemmatimonadales bacterium]